MGQRSRQRQDQRKQLPCKSDSSRGRHTPAAGTRPNRRLHKGDTTRSMHSIRGRRAMVHHTAAGGLKTSYHWVRVKASSCMLGTNPACLVGAVLASGCTLSARSRGANGSSLWARCAPSSAPTPTSTHTHTRTAVRRRPMRCSRKAIVCLPCSQDPLQSICHLPSLQTEKGRDWLKNTFDCRNPVLG